FVSSGIRVGTPALTTRGMGAEEMKLIGNWMAEVLENISDDTVVTKTRDRVRDLCKNFPIY
ncbi:MAG: serine hydroxymethyltransferase, partial [Bdellovibrionales bacterium]|nr:serine hydroxymethyltransferase [Bdellovibrionales bacterium]